MRSPGGFCVGLWSAIRYDSTGTLWYCYRDVHQGQFRQGGNTDCQRCHDESKFTTTKFDHNRDSRFKLDATHAAVPCARCHTAVASPAGPVTRYRPLGIECKDCHLPAKRGSPR